VVDRSEDELGEEEVANVSIEVFECAGKYWDADKIEAPPGPPAMKGVKNGRNSSTENEPIKHRRIDRIVEQLFRADETESDPLVVERDNSLSSPLMVRVNSGACHDIALGLDNPKDRCVVDWNANADAPDLSYESGARWYVEIVCKFHVR